MNLSECDPGMHGLRIQSDILDRDHLNEHSDTHNLIFRNMTVQSSCEPERSLHVTSHSSAITK